ncbi:MAG TPA: hypothetical protein VME69_10250 [Methylocella sp.]|nr:hypothetical protein [Methylocella sp.]
MAENEEKQTLSPGGVWGIVLTGLLALLGTAVSGVIKGYWDSVQAQDSFQSTLILRALEPTDPEARVTSLKFLVRTHLIRDPSVVKGINEVVAEGAQSVPRFAPANSPELGGVMNVPSVKALVTAEPTLTDAKLALVGLRVRYGDVIDAIGPLFAPIEPGLKLGETIFGGLEGGGGGQETVLEEPGYIVTEIDVVRGTYFGREEVAQLRLIWHRLKAQGIEAEDQKVSKMLGSGHFVSSEQVKHLIAAPGNYISDFSPTLSSHTSGEVFLNDLRITSTPLNERKRDSTQ